MKLLQKIYTISLMICFTFLIFAHSETVEASSFREVKQVNVSSLVVKQAATDTSATVGTLPKGEFLTIFSTTNGWAYVQGKSLSGYVNSTFLTTPISTIKIASSKSGLVVKQTPTMKTQTLATLKYNMIVEDFGSVGNGWSFVQYGNVTGYVATSFINTPKSTNMYTQNTVALLNIASPSGAVLSTLAADQQVTVHSTIAGWTFISTGSQRGYVPANQLSSVKKAQAQGKVVQLKVPYYNQYLANAPMGCEASSLLQALHYKGYAKEYNLENFLKQMPIDKNGNPNNGFGGTPYKVVNGVYQSIFAKPLAQWGSKYGTVENISGASVAQLKEELDKGNPIVVYITLDYKAPVYEKYNWGTGIDNAHVVTLTGYKDGYYHVTDPARGVKWVSAKSFEYSYNLTKSAVVVR